MIDYAAMSPGEFNDAMTGDAMQWAEAFEQMVIKPGKPITKEIMLGWFANAMCKEIDEQFSHLVHDPVAFMDYVGEVTRTRSFLAELALNPPDDMLDATLQ